VFSAQYRTSGWIRSTPPENAGVTAAAIGRMSEPAWRNVADLQDRQCHVPALSNDTSYGVAPIRIPSSPPHLSSTALFPVCTHVPSLPRVFHGNFVSDLLSLPHKEEACDIGKCSRNSSVRNVNPNHARKVLSVAEKLTMRGEGAPAELQQA
jgi:hypothetical protein